MHECRLRKMASSSSSHHHQQQQTKITVVKGKGSVQVLDWGRGPFGVEKTKRGNAFIPNGFKIRCKSDSQYWIGETHVNKELQPHYQFTLEKDPSIKSGWFPTSTAAYNEANRLAKNEKFNKGSNGRLIIGLTYPVLQQIICNMNNLPYNLISSPESSPRSLTPRTHSSSQTIEEKEPDSPKRSRHEDKVLEQPFESPGHYQFSFSGNQLIHHRASFQYPSVDGGLISTPFQMPPLAGSLMEPIPLSSFSATSSTPLPNPFQSHYAQTASAASPSYFSFDEDTLFLLENLTTEDLWDDFDNGTEASAW